MIGGNIYAEAWLPIQYLLTPATLIYLFSWAVDGLGYRAEPGRDEYSEFFAGTCKSALLGLWYSG